MPFTPVVVNVVPRLLENSQRLFIQRNEVELPAQIPTFTLLLIAFQPITRTQRSCPSKSSPSHQATRSPILSRRTEARQCLFLELKALSGFLHRLGKQTGKCPSSIWTA